MELKKKTQVLEISADRQEETSASLVQEVPLTIFLNGLEVVTLLCTGHHLDDLALGFLKSEGLMDSTGELKSLQVDEGAGVARVSLHQEVTLKQALHMKRTLGSGCGRASLYYQPLDALQISPIESPLRLRVSQIRERMNEMNQASSLYKETRCTHNASLAQADRILVNREDIGRHNAADMIVGYAMRNGIDLSDKMLLTTGRASSEIVIKAARVAIPVLVSRSAPTYLGVAIADRVGMTLVGYVRGNRMILYAHPERVNKTQSVSDISVQDLDEMVKGTAIES